MSEREFKPFPWEGAMPHACKNCTGGMRYVSAVCYEAHVAKEECAALRAENERLKVLIDLIQSGIRNLSRENMQKMQAGIDYRPKRKGVRASA